MKKVLLPWGQLPNWVAVLCMQIRIVLFVLNFYLPVNNFSVMSGWVFLGQTSTKQRINLLKYPAQGHKAVPSVRLPNYSLRCCKMHRFNAFSNVR